jgi:tetratricopeptide (TPR) repeat protein
MSEAIRAMEAERAIFERLARDNPAVTRFQASLAFSHNGIGFGLSEMGKPAEALKWLEAALAIFEKLARDHPTVLRFQLGLAATHDSFGSALRKMGKPAEALRSYEAARGVWETLARDNPTHTEYLWDVALNHAIVGKVLTSMGKPDEAIASFRLARTASQRLPSDWMYLYNQARFSSLAAGEAGKHGSGMTPAEGRAEANRAMDTLRRAVAAGFRNVVVMQNDTNLDPLRGRDDFRLLMMDLAFPFDPFARVD